MKLTVTYILLLCLQLTAFSRQPVDSLLHRLQTTEKITDRIDLLNQVGREYIDAHPDSALIYCSEAEKLSEKEKYKHGLFSAYLTYGILNKNQGNNNTALSYYFRYLRIAEESQKTSSAATAFNNIGVIYRLLKNYKQALRYYNKSLALKITLGKQNEIASTLNNIGNVYLDLHKHGLALLHFRKALELNRHFNNEKFQSINYQNMAFVHLEQNTLDSADLNFRKALELSAKAGNKVNEAEQMHGLAETEFKRGNTREAMRLAYKSLNLAQRIRRKETILEDYLLLKNLYTRAGRTDSALHFASAYIALNDSVLNDNLSNITSDHEFSYELDKADLTIQSLQRNKVVLSIMMVLSVMVLALLALYISRRSRYTHRIEEKNQQLIELDHKKNSIIRMVAHDLKNPLININGLSQLLMMDEAHAKSDEKLMVQMINEVSLETTQMINKFLTAEGGGEGLIKVNMEQADLKALVETEISRFVSRAAMRHIELILQGLVEPLVIRTDAQLLKQVLDNLLSNAIKYSFEHKRVWVNVSVYPQEIVIEVRDEGPGIEDRDQIRIFTRYMHLLRPGTEKTDSNGLGLSITKELVEHLGGSVWFRSQKGTGTSFFVKLPR